MYTCAAPKVGPLIDACSKEIGNLKAMQEARAVFRKKDDDKNKTETAPKPKPKAKGKASKGTARTE